MNLVLNACEAMPKGGRLEISAQGLIGNESQESSRQDRKEEEGEEKATWIEIAVSDTGSGIPQDLLDRVFDPFFTTKKVGEGTGLGMNIAYDIIANRHGGKIEVVSEEGTGTEFCIELPRQQELVVQTAMSA